MQQPIADLHCDLLCYLERDPVHRTEMDPEAKCSIPQLQKGGVVFQTLAVFTETRNGSSLEGSRQFALFQKLLQKHSSELHPLHKGPFKPITIAASIENGSSLIEEDEKFDVCLIRLEKMQKEAGPILYISLTWNTENRFGGGNASSIGLKRDGEILLEFLHKKKIAIDLSHTSDHLAHDILNYIDKKNLDVQPIASHSNFRKIAPVPRNLSDEIAREIIRRKGMIGINFVRFFVGQEPSDFLKQVNHGIELGGEKALCFGADFFSEIDIPPELMPYKPAFFAGFDQSGCYPKLLELLKTKFPEPFLKDLAHRNLQNFLATTF